MHVDNQPNDQEREPEKEPKAWLRRTSDKFLAIGAGLEAFLRFTDRIVFSKEPCREPDKEFIAELVLLMKPAETSAPPVPAQAPGDD